MKEGIFMDENIYEIYKRLKENPEILKKILDSKGQALSDEELDEITGGISRKS
jgi:uncharacterized Fe-S cluster-containing MiaB family protein